MPRDDESLRAAKATIAAAPVWPGRYRHLKGGEYDVLHVGIDEATLQPVVVYRATTDGTVWVRSLPNFIEHVEQPGGGWAARFTRLPDSPERD